MYVKSVFFTGMKPLSAVFCLLFPLVLSAQSDKIPFSQAKQLLGTQKILDYRLYSMDMKDASAIALNDIVVRIRTNPDIIKYNILVLQVFTCVKERQVKPYLGVVRAQRLIDYLEKELGLSRRKCLILDEGPSEFDTNCTVGAGINVYLKPGS